MVREEYLNPEFMYKLINSLCKKDGWIMYHFVFGKLTYRNFKQPILMQNNHGYNMVYKFQVYKLQDNVNFGEYDEILNAIRVTSSNFEKNIITKVIYFDILNECFVEDDDTVSTLEEFPSFFRLDNQLYYGIYNQPSVLRHHYSEARCSYSQENYLKIMNINSHNLFSPHDLLDKLIDRNKKIDNYYSDEEWEFCFKTQEEANSTILKVLRKTYTPYDFAKVYNVDENLTRSIAKDYKFKLYIHNESFPVFYTDNVLELTIPIAEAVKELADKVTCVLYSIKETLYLLSGSIKKLMNDRIKDTHATAFSNYFKTNENRIAAHGELKAVVREGIEFANNCVFPLMIERDKRSNEMNHKISSLSPEISQVQSCCEELYSNIQKIKDSEFSLNTMLEISNGFKILESKISEKA